MKRIFSPLIAFAAAVAAFVGEHLHRTLTGYMGRSGLIAHMDIQPSDFAANRVTNPLQSEIVRNRLYDYQLYLTAGVTQLSFFQQPVGQGLTSALGSTVGAAKSQWDTNMEIGGTLPSGKAYLIESIEVLFLPGSVSTANTYTLSALSLFAVAAAATVAGQLNDINSFYQSGMLELNVLSKNYLRETPLMAFPPKAHLDVYAATATNSATVGQVSQVLGKATGRPYYLEPKITLQPAVNFEVLLKWPSAVATPSGFNGRVGVILDGGFMRASQ